MDDMAAIDAGVTSPTYKKFKLAISSSVSNDFKKAISSSLLLNSLRNSCIFMFFIKTKYTPKSALQNKNPQFSCGNL
jgi:hypothetical protein